MTELTSSAEQILKLGIAGLAIIVAIVAFGFAWYQTKRIERLTDKLLDKFSGALVTAAQLFELNPPDEEEIKKHDSPAKKTKS